MSAFFRLHSQAQHAGPALRHFPVYLRSQGGKVHDQAPANTWDSREPLRWAQERCFPRFVAD
ncbi:hypothetical protein CFAM422_011460 [Trichoderma lentiforme]|uniref:Uncharacterized protein n=1 Tax=Trichoderma lentiforme TaxID=1567552 RepID=A0A9P5C9P3_9HYPO|nr:hypothetical protein CFAM422_011460 [Trichoderma lentiforme]